MPMNGQDAYFNGEAQRKDHPVVLSTNRHLATILPVRLAHRGSAYLAGQVIARDDADGYYKAFSAVSGGTYDSIGVLFESLGASAATGGFAARAVFGGEVYKSVLIDYDATAKTQMGAREVTDMSATTIVKF